MTVASAAARSSAPEAPTLEVIKARSGFLAAARAARAPMPGMILQARRRSPSENVASDVIRVGYTCSKKVGNAVARNRAKRRLRAVARDILPSAACPGWDYVLIGRREATAARRYDRLAEDLRGALGKVHR